MKKLLLDDAGHQFWLVAMSDGVDARFSPAYIGDGWKLHAINISRPLDYFGYALCGKGGRLRRGAVLDDDAICASCKRILEAGP